MTETRESDGPLTVGQVAERFGVTRRTLHHYDEIGLVVPGERSTAGYRLYTSDDLTRLAQVVVYRRLEFGLEEIASLLAEPQSAAAHLARQRAAVMSRVEELRGLLDAIDDALEATMNEQTMTTEQMRELFGDGFREEYQAEAEQRWGDTPQWKQSQERQKSWSPADWARIKDDTETLEADLADALGRGVAPDSDEAAALAERHLEQLRVHYDCDHAFQARLATMYTDDPRFAAHYDERRPGLARFVREAIEANAARHA